MSKDFAKTYVVVPTYTGSSLFLKGIQSVIDNGLSPNHILVVNNGYKNPQLKEMSKKFPEVKLINSDVNLGFAGGVNLGIKQAIKLKAKYIMLLNDDAVVQTNCLQELIKPLKDDNKIGIVTSKIISSVDNTIDSSGDFYSTWGLPAPRGRGEADKQQYDLLPVVFAASGGASVYRAELFEDVGLFDEDFFAYYEDVDISYRAQLRGWQVVYRPSALVKHEIGATSSKISGFATYHTFKNLPWLLFKNVPRGQVLSTWLRLELALSMFFVSALFKGKGWPAFKGWVIAHLKLAKKLSERRVIQSRRLVTSDYIASAIYSGIPPSYVRLKEVIDKLHRS